MMIGKALKKLHVVPLNHPVEGPEHNTPLPSPKSPGVDPAPSRPLEPAKQE